MCAFLSLWQRLLAGVFCGVARNREEEDAWFRCPVRERALSIRVGVVQGSGAAPGIMQSRAERVEYPRRQKLKDVAVVSPNQKERVVGMAAVPLLAGPFCNGAVFY